MLVLPGHAALWAKRWKSAGPSPSVQKAKRSAGDIDKGLWRWLEVGLAKVLWSISGIGRGRGGAVACLSFHKAELYDHSGPILPPLLQPPPNQQAHCSLCVRHIEAVGSKERSVPTWESQVSQFGVLQNFGEGTTFQKGQTQNPNMTLHYSSTRVSAMRSEW